MAKGSSGKISITISAGTAQFIADMEQAKVKVRDFSQGTDGLAKSMHGSVSGTQAASGALRLLEGNFTNNIRAVERFAASTLGLGDLLTKIFPLVGAAASIGILAKLGEEAYNFFRSIQDAPEKAKGAFRELDNALRTTNDDLIVANDKLQNVINKLEGKRQNTIKLALDEARAAADHLTDSLDKSLGSLTKLLKEQSIGAFRQALGEQGIKDVERELGGKTGTGGFRGKIADISASGLTGKELGDALSAAYSKELESVNKKLSDAELHERQRTSSLLPNIGPFAALDNKPSDGSLFQKVFGSDAESRVEVLKGVRRTLQLESANVPLAQQNTDLTKKKEALEANHANELADKPFTDRIKKIQAEIEAVRVNLAAVGQGQTGQILAKAFGAATLAIEEVNKGLERHHKQLNATQKAEITSGEEILALEHANLEFAKSIDSVNNASRARIQSEQFLTEAIGKSYEATRKANAESRLAIEFAEKDAAFLARNSSAVDGRRTALNAEFDAANKQRIGKAVDGLGDQIELERNLAAVQKDGAEAVRLVALAYRLKEIATKGGVINTREQIKEEIDLFHAQKANLSAEQLAQLSQKEQAIKRITDAQILGAEAVRQANLENKYADLKKQSVDPAVINAERKTDNLERQREITGEALKRVNAYKDQLEQLEPQIAKLKEIQAAGKGTLETGRALRDLEDERLHTLAQQALSLGTARDGIRAFFLEVQTHAIKTSQIVFDALNSAVDRVSENLAKGLTGQKTNFGQAFKEIGEQLLQSTIKQQLQGAIGSIGKALGISALAGKPDGSSADRALWVQMANAGMYGAGPIGTAAAGGSGPLGGLLGKISGGLGGLIIKNFAGGNTATSTSPSASSGGITLNIDARGSTDPLLTVERVTQAIAAAHDNAIAGAVLAVADRAFRTPSVV